MAKVEFIQTSIILRQDITYLYSFTWSNVAAGTYVLTARATDNLGAVTESIAVTITVNPPINQPPEISIMSPTDGATYTEPALVPITVYTNDNDGSVTKVEFFEGSMILGENVNYPYSFTWHNSLQASIADCQDYGQPRCRDRNSIAVDDNCQSSNQPSAGQ